MTYPVRLLKTYWLSFVETNITLWVSIFYTILGGSLESSGNQILARPPLVYLYTVAFGDQDYGRGSAGAFILTLLILLFTLLPRRLFGLGKARSQE